jgi:hypothetical protein
MIQVRCEKVSRGMRDSDAIATVRDYHGRRHFLHIEKDFLTSHDSHWALPVALIHRDPPTGAVLIEFPQEAETGVNRIWVGAEDVVGNAGVTA